MKKFKIVEWSRSIKDFQIPKDYRLAEFREFVDAYDNDLIEMEKYPVIYFVKHFSKKQQKREYCISRVYLSRYLDKVNILDLNSGNGYLAYSNEIGRVVLVKVKK